MTQRMSEDREWDGLLLPKSASEVLAAEANEGGSWWLAEESRLIKLPTARIPVFDCRRTIAFGRKAKRKQKSVKN